MVKSIYDYVGDQWKKHDISFKSPQQQRLIQWRKEENFLRVDKPLRIDRARSLGYKAKQGYIIVRARIRKGGMHKVRPDQGRKNRALGVNRYTTGKNLQWIAEERAQRKYPNMQVLNSYKIYADGKHFYFEVILVDPNHPVIKADSNINWITEPAHRKRVNRGLTSAGKRSRGLRKKGWGSEKTRPSVRSRMRRRAFK